MASTDVDGDNIQDLFASQPGRGEIYLLYGRAHWKNSGSLEEHEPIPLFKEEAGTGSWRISHGDLDGDGLQELTFILPESGAEARTEGGRAWILKPYLPVRIDVRPEASANVVFFPGGTSAVRIFGFSRAEKDQIDAATLHLAGVLPMRCITQDYDEDKIPDLQALFDTTKMRLSPGARHVGITARTRSGMPVGGTDSIFLMPPTLQPSVVPQYVSGIGSAISRRFGPLIIPPASRRAKTAKKRGNCGIMWFVSQ